MAAFNGVRVLPDIPKIETLIQEFKTDLRSSSRQDTVSESSTSSSGSFVKKIIEAYESNVRVSIENAEQKHASKRSGLFKLHTIQNQKNEKSDSTPSICGELGSLRRWTSFKNTPEISFVSSIKKNDLEDDFVISNQYHCKNDKKSDILRTWSEISSKINRHNFMREMTNNIWSNFSKKSEMETPQKRSQFCSPPESEKKRKSKNHMPLICSSPLEDVNDKDTEYDEDPLDDILTNSRDSSNNSNNSYKNLQGDLYDFESKKLQFELSSTSSQSLNSSLRSSHDDISSTDSYTNDSLLLESSFQDITVLASKDVLNDRENSQAVEQILKSSSDFNRESPRVIDVSKRPIKIDNDTSLTWIPVDQKLPQKKSLKKLMSMFNRAKQLLNKKIGKKLKEKQLKKRYIFDSGFIEQCPSSSSSQQSWHSDADHVDDEPSTLPTFGTFGRPKCVREHRTEKTVKNRMMLTEILDAPKLASDFVSFDPNPRTFSRKASSSKENHQDVEPSSRSTSIASFSKSRVFCKYPLLPKHPHLIHSSIPKHPFVAPTKMDQIEREATAEKAMQYDERIEQKPVLEPKCSSTLPIPVPQSTLNISYPRRSECTDSPTSSNYDTPNLHKSTSAFDEVVFRRRASAYDVPRCSWLSSLTMDSSPPVYGDNLYEEIVPCKPRFATVSPKNLRFFISQEKSRAIEKSIDS
ncbi:uncharacterized protein [Anoplolepis gracilipes]|uniref:uncharacterized protein n=1 Tax=Anoplolepis gracilipes TaxID=354296 RepID=UPI003B9F5CE4